MYFVFNNVQSVRQDIVNSYTVFELLTFIYITETYGIMMVFMLLPVI